MLSTSCNIYNFFQNLDDGDHIFIVEVFSGCVQYTKLIDVVVEGFYATDGEWMFHLFKLSLIFISMAYMQQGGFRKLFCCFFLLYSELTNMINQLD